MAYDEVPLRPAWLEIDLGAIERNTRRLVDIAAGAELMAMVKANAYGHGAVEVSRAVLRGGAAWLGVLSAGEGIELRRAGITAPILVVGHTPIRWVRDAVAQGLTLAVASLASAEAIAAAASDLNTTAGVHLKIDTGMTRLGILPEEAVKFASALLRLHNLRLDGVYTHFSMADEPDGHSKDWGREFTQQQLERFHGVVTALDRAGIPVRYRHCANSPATLTLPEAHFNLVRSGILIYGLDPSPEVPCPVGFTPALAFKTEVAAVKDVPEGHYVGYGATYRTTRPTRLAVLMVGYADGFRRAPRNYCEVLVHGKRASIAGRICMDQTMIDVTAIEGVAAGDEVVLIGRQGSDEIRAEEVAQKLGANNYETVSTLSARLERRYIRK